MRIILLSLTFLLLAGSTYAQPGKLLLPENLRKIYSPVPPASQPTGLPIFKKSNKFVRSSYFPEQVIDTTWYDQQSERSAPAGRFIMFQDGTMSTVWITSIDTVAFSDRGTAYAYYDGNNWSIPPVGRIESVSTCSPSLARLGSNGEMVLAAQPATGPLHMCSRVTKGNGEWTENDLPLPPGVSGLVNPKMVTSGQDHSVIHILSLTTPVSQGGALYHGQDGALVYQRSTDGGLNWDINGAVPAGMDSSQYNGFSPDTYAFAEPRDNKLAFLVGDPWSDLFLMKSDDNGLSWQKTVIWQHPVPHWNGEATDTIFCPDGSVHLAFDNMGMIHIVFGLTSLYSDGTQTFRAPYIGGIAYWKEDQPTWTGGDQYNCLNPDSVDAHSYLIGNYALDWNGNGTLDILGNFGDYNVGPISFPQIAFDDFGTGLLLMSAITEGYNNGIQDYRHILCRYMYFNEAWSQVIDFNDDPVHMFDECVFPSLCAIPDYMTGWYFSYQADNEPGMAVSGDHDAFGINQIYTGIHSFPIPSPYINIMVSANPPQAGIVSGGGIFLRGSSVTIEAHDNSGWEFVNWTQFGTVLSTDSVFTFIASDIWNLVANFRLIEGMTDPELKGITASPNPANGFLNLDFPADLIGQHASIITFDVVGVPIKIINHSIEKRIRLDVSDLPPAVYMLKLNSGKGKQFVTRVIVR